MHCLFVAVGTWLSSSVFHFWLGLEDRSEIYVLASMHSKYHVMDYEGLFRPPWVVLAGSYGCVWAASASYSCSVDLSRSSNAPQKGKTRVHRGWDENCAKYVITLLTCRIEIVSCLETQLACFTGSWDNCMPCSEWDFQTCQWLYSLAILAGNSRLSERPYWCLFIKICDDLGQSLLVFDMEWSRGILITFVAHCSFTTLKWHTLQRTCWSV